MTGGRSVALLKPSNGAPCRNIVGFISWLEPADWRGGWLLPGRTGEATAGTADRQRRRGRQEISGVSSCGLLSGAAWFARRGDTARGQQRRGFQEYRRFHLVACWVVARCRLQAPASFRCRPACCHPRAPTRQLRAPLNTSNGAALRNIEGFISRLAGAMARMRLRQLHQPAGGMCCATYSTGRQRTNR